MIIGSISGIRPTAIVTENSSADAQFPFVIPLVKKIIGTITSMKRKSRLLTDSTPRSKLFFALLPFSDFAMLPRYVSFPVVSITAMALPLTTFVPINPIFCKSVREIF